MVENAHWAYFHIHDDEQCKGLCTCFLGGQIPQHSSGRAFIVAERKRETERADKCESHGATTIIKTKRKNFKCVDSKKKKAKRRPYY